MKQVLSPVLRGVVVPIAVVCLAACSSQVTAPGAGERTHPAGSETMRETMQRPPAEASERMAGRPEEASATRGATSGEPQGQGQQGQGEGQQPSLAQQRRQTLINESLGQARRAMELRLWEDAARVAAQVLDLDPDNEEARRILFAAQDMLGQPGAGAARQIEERALQGRIAYERDRARAAQEESVGDANMQTGRYGDAADNFQRALLILRYSPYFQPGSELEQRLDQKLQNALTARARADQERSEAERAASRAELAEAARRLRLQTEIKVTRLLEQANYEFQLGNYGSALRLLDQALQADPRNDQALGLRDLAARAMHENRVDLLRQEWKQEWSKTFDQLRTADVPQTEAIEFDMERWAEVARRQPITFTPPAELDSPQKRAILEKLRETRLEHRFPRASVEEWARYYQTVTEINFVVTPPVREMEEARTTLTDFVLPPMSVERALNVIAEVTGVYWKVEDGVVKLVTAENAGGPSYLQHYTVKDLVQGVQDRPGRELKLAVPGEEPDFGFGDDTESKPTVVEASKLIEVIRQTINPEIWDKPEVASISEAKGVLIVRAPAEQHERIQRLLADLRQAVGIQVDIEARFLKVEDSFLEDIGVDFRGLGDQSAGGVPGRGLELNNRANLRFDDFGQPQTISPANPGEMGTGTEPGIFFDDGQDGDFLGRTEHLYDRTLGGGEDRLSSSGGLSLQWAYLDDVELEVVLRAVQKQERSEEVTAPRLLVYNNTRANMQVLRHTSFIKDFEVEIAQAAAVANPVVDVVHDGVVLDVRPVVSADRRFITMELRPTVMTLQEPIPTFTTTLGVGQPISIQLPRVTLQRVRTTVTMPDGGTIMLGGMNFSEKQNLVSGIPVLKDLPGLSFLFSRKGTFIQNKKLLILIRAKIILSEEHEPVIAPPPQVPVMATAPAGG